MRIISYLSAFLLLTIPVISHAAWWNPSSWFPQKASSTTEVRTVYITVPATTTEATTSECIPQTIIKTLEDPSQASEIKTLEQEVSDLKDELSLQPSSSIPPVIKTEETNDDQVKAIKTSIAEIENAKYVLARDYNQSMSQMVQPDESEILQALNAIKMPDGSPALTQQVYLDDAQATAIVDDNGDLTEMPSYEATETVLADYEDELNIQLEAAEAVQ